MMTNLRERRLSTAKIQRQLMAMLALHARAVHLPHIRRYHATRKKQLKTYDKSHPSFGRLTKSWILPVYLLDLSSGTFGLSEESRNGNIQFLSWNRAMPIVSEIRGDSRLVSVATGPGAATQHRILQRLLSRRKIKQPVIVSAPALHFRGVAYVDRKDKGQRIIPLRSPMAPLKSGKSYRSKFVLEKLGAAFTQRVNAEQRIRGRQK
jgi:hypothetical protein